MPRTIQQTEIQDALVSLKVGMEGSYAAFSQFESYYRSGAAVDLDAHPQSGLEVLTGLLQRLDALARTLRQDALGSVERLWAATEAELQSVHQHQLAASPAGDPEERGR